MGENVGFLRKLYRKLLYSDLDKVYKSFFSAEQKPKNRMKFLDVGAGFGFEVIKRGREGYFSVGLEFLQERAVKTLGEFRKRNANGFVIVGDAQDLPFREGVFDLINCNHVIEHVPEDSRTLGELSRVLNKKGKLLLAVPNVKNLYTAFRSFLGLKNRFTDSTHLREYEENELRRLIETAGFKIEDLKRVGFNPPIGLKVELLLAHYMPIDKALNSFVRIFPKRAAEFRVKAGHR
ncbi:MAG: class I SAM-dependent methyltransferase [Candidatus Aenigmarchaeota archaeon]|nr:class I SAM-dependent methyltransferase [Candidatus Aenigmarchaeota archaeon]